MAWHDRSNVGNLIRLAVPSYKSSLVEYSVISCYLNANLHKRNKKKEDHRVETNAISVAWNRFAGFIDRENIRESRSLNS